MAEAIAVLSRELPNFYVNTLKFVRGFLIGDRTDRKKAASKFRKIPISPQDKGQRGTIKLSKAIKNEIKNSVKLGASDCDRRGSVGSIAKTSSIPPESLPEVYEITGTL